MRPGREPTTCLMGGIYGNHWATLMGSLCCSGSSNALWNNRWSDKCLLFCIIWLILKLFFKTWFQINYFQKKYEKSELP